MPGRHGPPLVSRLLPPVMGSLLEFETVDGRPLLRLYVTGDTLLHDGMREIRARYGDIDIALLHLGGARVLGLRLTMDAAQGVALMRIVQPRLAIPIHDDDTAVTSPLSDFQEAVSEAGLSDRVHYLLRGDTFAFKTPPAASFAPPEPERAPPQPRAPGDHQWPATVIARTTSRFRVRPRPGRSGAST